ncbi:DEAD/DEAH box helicase [Dyella silvae]|uniref:DEAD/DEAH box helicase n=1 Tax=Dyella silvae TaxID=2994424 RepID=UPI00226413C3|nr:DEAD/DEAH box helicase [Dyella silvae]
MTASTAFHLLDERIQRFLWVEQWEALRDVQELAIPLIVAGDQDVIVAAATAAGKTEAAFLPALTHLLQHNPAGLIVYVSPLKALINDQFGRLERLCETLEIPVWPWHGDVSSSVKSRFLKKPSGVLLITPESLEAMLCNRGTAVAGAFSNAVYFVVDELHAFIGSERGKQLQSLMHRIDSVLGRQVPRIGLSATLGDMQLAATFLRSGRPVAIVETGSGGATLKVLVKGFEEPARLDKAPGPNDGLSTTAIARDLFTNLRGSNNLVFPNSRREVERYAHLLSGLCEEARIANEFWPHHGSLSREIRNDTEVALKQKDRPATAVCTSTLELGIDIGAVKSVAQIGPPPSVASLRQRLGRSGRRRGESAILRGFVIEDALGSQSTFSSQLRLDVVEIAASISLLLENWFEPPVTHGAHLSTLVQQLLSVIAQYGGMNASSAYRLLCGSGAPFEGLSPAMFTELLRHLGQEKILQQDGSGLLLHGPRGDQLVNHYTFYAAFLNDEEFRVVTGGKALGTLPVHQLLVAGQRILFAGRTWLVESVNDSDKTIFVTPSKGGAPPLFSGTGGRIHSRVRQRMRELYRGSGLVRFLDPTAQRFLDEGRLAYQGLALDERWLVDQGPYCLLLTWLGDAANEALACRLSAAGLPSALAPLGVEVTKGDLRTEVIIERVMALAHEAMPGVDDLLAEAKNLQRQKWDWALPPKLLRATYASLNLDLDEAQGWLASVHSLPNDA